MIGNKDIFDHCIAYLEGRGTSTWSRSELKPYEGLTWNPHVFAPEEGAQVNDTKRDVKVIATSLSVRNTSLSVDFEARTSCPNGVPAYQC